MRSSDHWQADFSHSIMFNEVVPFQEGDVNSHNAVFLMMVIFIFGVIEYFDFQKCQRGNTTFAFILTAQSFRLL